MARLTQVNKYCHPQRAGKPYALAQRNRMGIAG
jgi:hypothetical protein